MQKVNVLCAMVTIAVSLAALLVSSPRRADDFTERAMAKLDDPTYQFFKDEIKDEYPGHVAAYAIVTAKVEEVKEVLYCPGKTAKCGVNPTCNDPMKQTIKTLDITIGELLVSSSDAALPKQFKDRAYFGSVALAKGDDVYLSLYIYRDEETKKESFSNIARIKKMSDEKADR